MKAYVKQHCGIGQRLLKQDHSLSIIDLLNVIWNRIMNQPFARLNNTLHM